MAKASASMQCNCDIASYLCIKLSWRGKYKRIFTVGTEGITTYNPQNFQITNQWLYNEIAGIYPKPNSDLTNEFILHFIRPGKKNDSMRFSCDFRAELLTNILKFRHKFYDDSQYQLKIFQSFKHHWSETKLPIILQVGPSSLDQVEQGAGIISSYEYQEVEGFALMADEDDAFAIYYGGFQRMHVFTCRQRSELIDLCVQNAAKHIGMHLKCKEGIPFDNFTQFRLGKYSDDDAVTSLVEFRVSKISTRVNKPIRRILCLTESAIVERDPATYSIVTVKPLCDVFAVVRDMENPQLFTLQYVRCGTRQYLSTERDALLSTLLDSVRGSGNEDVYVCMEAVHRALRVVPLYAHADEETEVTLLKSLAFNQDEKSLCVAINRFNANVGYSGLLLVTMNDAKERMVQSALGALLEKGAAVVNSSDDAPPPLKAAAQFAAIRRLVASKPGFNAFGLVAGVRDKLGKFVMRALRRGHSGVTHAAVEVLGALMQPMHDNYDLKQEQNNKTSILASDKFVDGLLELLSVHVERGSGALVISSLLDLITFGLCAPYSETTDGATFDRLLDKVSKMGVIVFKLFQHSSMSITKSAGMIMRALIEEGTEANAKALQDLALAQGSWGSSNRHITIPTL